MKNKKNQKVKEEKRHYDKGQIFVKVMAGILEILMLTATCGTFIYALIG